jgi:hypothetical protein
MDVLDSVEETLRKTEAAAAEREQALAHLLPSSDAEAKHWANGQIDLLPPQMQGWSAVLQGAENESSAADAVLNAAEEALRQWLSQAEARAQGLAQRVVPCI